MTKSTLRNFAAIALFVLPVVLTTACSRSEAALETGREFGGKLDSELYLRADGQKEARREVEYWKGTRLLKRVTVFYASGGKQISVYRENGTIRVLTEWYPDPSLTAAPPAEATPSLPVTPVTALPVTPATSAVPQISSTTTTTPAAAQSETATAGDTVAATPVVGAQTPEEALATDHTAKVADPQTKFGKVKRSVEYGEDGKTVVKSSFYREDGTMAAYGLRTDAETFEQREYLVDGKTMARQQKYTNEGDVIFMRVVVGTQTDSITHKVENVEVTTKFGPDGMRVTRTFRAPYTNYEDIEFYKEDARSLKYIVYRQTTMSILFFKDDGSVDHLRAWGYDGSMTVTKYRDGAGKTKPEAVNGLTPKEAYRQHWRAGSKDANGNVTYTLSRVDEIGADGRMTRRIDFSSTTNQPEKLYYMNDKDQTVRVVTLREDQTVERVENYEYPPQGGAATITPTEVAREKGVRESFDEGKFKATPYEDARKLVGDPLPQPYYYDYGWDH